MRSVSLSTVLAGVVFGAIYWASHSRSLPPRSVDPLRSPSSSFKTVALNEPPVPRTPEEVATRGEQESAIESSSTVSSAVSPRGCFEGRVIDSKGRSLAGATVSVSGPSGAREEITNDEGHFAIPNLPPGIYFVRAELDGYFNPRIPELGESESSVVVRVMESEVSTIEVVLSRGESYELAVQTTGGDGLPGVRCGLQLKTGTGVVFHAVSDGSGRVRWKGLPRGPVRLTVEPSWEKAQIFEGQTLVELPREVRIPPGAHLEVAVRSTSGGVLSRTHLSLRRNILRMGEESTFGATIVDGVARFRHLPAGPTRLWLSVPQHQNDGPREIHLVSGQWATLSVTLKADPVRFVDVVVWDDKDRPVPNATVSIQSAGGMEVRATDAAGRARVKAVGQFRQVSVLAPGYVPRHRGVDDDDLESPCELTLTPEAWLEVVVRDPEGSPLAGVPLSIEPVDSQPHGSAGRTNGDGTVRLPGLASGTYRVRSTGEREGLAEVTVQLVEGKRHQVLLTLPASVRITGQADVGGVPAPHASIRFLSLKTGRTQTAFTNPEGRFELRLFDLGRYELSFEDDLNLWKQPRSVMLTSDQNLDLHLPAHRIHGILRAANGAPLRQTAVTISGHATRNTLVFGEETLPQRFTDHQGRFFFEALTPGMYQLGVPDPPPGQTFRPARVSLQSDVEHLHYVAAPTVPVTLALKVDAGLQLHIHVLDLDRRLTKIGPLEQIELPLPRGPNLLYFALYSQKGNRAGVESVFADSEGTIHEVVLRPAGDLWVQSEGEWESVELRASSSDILPGGVLSLEPYWGMGDYDLLLPEGSYEFRARPPSGAVQSHRFEIRSRAQEPILILLE